MIIILLLQGQALGYAAFSLSLVQEARDRRPIEDMLAQGWPAYSMYATLQIREGIGSMAADWALEKDHNGTWGGHRTNV